MRVFMVRHGQSMDNKERRASGWGAAPLSELGLKQAASLNQILGKITFA